MAEEEKSTMEKEVKVLVACCRKEETALALEANWDDFATSGYTMIALLDWDLGLLRRP